MPIVSNTLQSTTQADGRISYVLRMYDQDGTEYTQAGFAPAGFDIDGLVTRRIAETDQQLAEQEFAALIGGA